MPLEIVVLGTSSQTSGNLRASQGLPARWSRESQYKIGYRWVPEDKIWNHPTLSYRVLIFKRNSNRQPARLK